MMMNASTTEDDNEQGLPAVTPTPAGLSYQRRLFSDPHTPNNLFCTLVSDRDSPLTDDRSNNNNDDNGGFFVMSPFGLKCPLPDCKRPQIQAEVRSITEHLKKHFPDCKEKYSTARAQRILHLYNCFVVEARNMRNMNLYRDCDDTKEYKRYVCPCGENFPTRKFNAIRHCERKSKKEICDISKISIESVVRMQCGRYASRKQMADFFSETHLCDTKRSDYKMVWGILEPLLPAMEKRDKTYTHMYTPLVEKRRDDGVSFLDKIRHDYLLIHEPPCEDKETALSVIHKLAKTWLCEQTEMDILRAPGNLWAYLQTFEKQEINDVSQRLLYTMQHDVARLLPDLLKLLSYAYRPSTRSPTP